MAHCGLREPRLLRNAAFEARSTFKESGAKRQQNCKVVGHSEHSPILYVLYVLYGPEESSIPGTMTPSPLRGGTGRTRCGAGGRLLGHFHIQSI
jgi:hypothetical protein